MGFLLEHDALNGRKGTATVTSNGVINELAGLKNIKANAAVDTSEFKVVGTITNQEKVKGVTYSGSATIYYGTALFLEMLKTYVKTGRFPEITIQITNDDEGTSVGKQTVVLYGVKFKEIPIAILDDSVDYLQIDTTFSFTSFEVLNAFNVPSQLGGN